MAQASHASSPNAFVAVRIPSPEIKGKMESVQEALLAKDKSLRSAIASTAENHITLMVLRLNDDVAADVGRAKKALSEATQKAINDLDLLRNPLVLRFCGLGNFSTNVLYADVEEGKQKERLIKMAEIVKSVFASQGFDALNTNNKWTPHLTIAKMTMRSTESCPGGIKPFTYAHLSSTDFGSQPIVGLELLSMGKPRARDGYYHCIHRCAF